MPGHLVANDPGIVALLGASRMGKSESARERLKRDKKRRLLIWSPLEPTDGHAGTFGAHLTQSPTQFIKSIQAGKPRVVLCPQADKMREWFSLFCRVAWECPGAAVFVEELSRVTSASWAPDHWRNLSTAGMHQRLLIVATAQRPAQIDKDFLGNCTEVRSFRLVYPQDAKAAADVIRCDPSELMQLPKHAYLHRDLNALTTVRGVQKKVSR